MEEDQDQDEEDELQDKLQESLDEYAYLVSEVENRYCELYD